MADDSELVYSTDPARNQKCLKCKRLIPECHCSAQETVPDRGIIAYLRIETANRNGKAVTVIDKLPPTEIFLEKLTKKLKTRCGSGGTYRTGNPYGKIEIQGDKRELIRKVLSEEGIQTKGA